VESAVVDGPIAKKGDGDVLLLQQFERVAGAGGLQNTGTDDAAGAHHADFGGKDVHAAPSPARNPGRPAQEFRHQLTRWDAFGQRMAVAAVGAEDGIVRA
jgi:hypothetical protein